MVAELEMYWEEGKTFIMVLVRLRMSMWTEAFAPTKAGCDGFGHVLHRQSLGAFSVEVSLHPMHDDLIEKMDFV